MKVSSTRPRSFLPVALSLWAALGFGLAAPRGGRAVAQTSDASPPAKTYRFVNGRWFDGRRFRRKVFYSVGGVLTRSPPRRVDETVDLAGGFVVPPFGDAHTHNFDNPYIFERVLKSYLEQGVFYAKVQSNFRTGAEQLSPRLNRPEGVDVLYAHGPLTGDFGHPIEIFEPVALGLFSPEQRRANADKILASRRAEGNAYHTVETPSDLERKWPAVLAGKPDFIKIMLLHSEAYAPLQEPPASLGARGLDPKLVPLVVARAHAAGLKVSAHVESAADYHTSLAAGVDEIAHLPGYYIAEGEDARAYEISAADAGATAGRGVTVVTTARLAENYKSMPALYERIRATQVRNLKLLKGRGVRLAVGGDTYGETAWSEVAYLLGLGVFTRQELLRMWCEETPRAIFPARKVGRLREGYEASFVVLKGDPLEDFGRVREVSLRFKQGRPVLLGK